MGRQRIATVAIESNKRYTNKSRLEDLSRVIDNTEADLFVFPAGYFSAGRKKAESIYSWIEQNIGYNKIVCLGVDGRVQKPWPKDQISLAVSSNKILACGRKFHPAPVEQGLTELADEFDTEEFSLPRIFTNGKKSYYLAVCYDSFGIRQRDLPNPGIDIIINNIHAFCQPGDGNSGDSYFARHGLAGASRQWECPVFAAAIFFERTIPKNWPTGVVWSLGKKSTRQWGYDKNHLEPVFLTHLSVSEGEARVQTYRIPHFG